MNDKVVIITINYNQSEFTLRCVESVLKSEYHNFQVILIDNSSDIKHQENLSKNLDNRVLLYKMDKNYGYIGGVNIGMQKAKELNPDYILIMNNDTIIDKQAVKNLVKACKEWEDKAIVTGKVYHYDDPCRFQYIGWMFKNKKLLLFDTIGFNETDEGQYDNYMEFDLIDDIFWLFPASLTNQIKGYSTYYWYTSEQADFAFKAKNIGYRLIYTPEAKLWHKGSISLGGADKNPYREYWNIQSSLIFRYIYCRTGYFVLFFLRIVRSSLATFFKSVFYMILHKKTYFKLSYAKLRALTYFLQWVIRKNENNGYNPIAK